MTRAGRRAMAAAWLACLVTRVADAQVPTVRLPPESAGWLPRVAFLLAIERFGSDDPQLLWDADFIGEFDIVASRVARATALFAYEAVLGDELQPFDPVQGNYAIELAGARRWGEWEAALVFHHTSRHRGDRPKLFGIAWNLLGVQATWTRAGPARAWQGEIRVARAVMADYVDYTGEVAGHGIYEQRVSPLVTVILRASAVARTVDARVFGRDTQVGGRLEVAWRVQGRAAALEAFAGVERRIDADPLALDTRRWALAGLRLQARR